MFQLNKIVHLNIFNQLVTFQECLSEICLQPFGHTFKILTSAKPIFSGRDSFTLEPDTYLILLLVHIRINYWSYRFPKRCDSDMSVYSSTIRMSFVHNTFMHGSGCGGVNDLMCPASSPLRHMTTNMAPFNPSAIPWLKSEYANTIRRRRRVEKTISIHLSAFHRAGICPYFCTFKDIITHLTTFTLFLIIFPCFLYLQFSKPITFEMSHHFPIIYLFSNIFCFLFPLIYK